MELKSSHYTYQNCSRNCTSYVYRNKIVVPHQTSHFIIHQITVLKSLSTRSTLNKIWVNKMNELPVCFSWILWTINIIVAVSVLMVTHWKSSNYCLFKWIKFCILWWHYFPFLLYCIANTVIKKDYFFFCFFNDQDLSITLLATQRSHVCFF